MDSNTENLINDLQNTISNYEKTNREQTAKIENLEEIIAEMNEKLSTFDNLIQENSNLNLELNQQNEMIQQKNKMISEFQELAKLSQIKFETFINNNNENKNAMDKKNKKYSEIPNQNIHNLNLLSFSLLQKEPTISIDKDDSFIRNNYSNLIK